MRQRLRPTPTPAELRQLYPAPHVHSVWPDHVIRVDVTVALGLGFVNNGMSVGDLSCGDAAIAKGIAAQRDVRVVLGDFAPGGYEFTGPIESTIDLMPPVDVFVCCETLEHLEDPDAVLKQIRAKAGRLILSTPDGETGSKNPEHVWGWDADEMETMLVGAGFGIGAFAALNLRPAGCMYNYQIWVCR